jgi:DNA-binding NarL/FixJ family response regulator
MNAIRAVMEGKTFLSPKVAAVFNKNDVPTGQSVDAKSALAALSRRQREILRLTTAGIPAKTIASDLNVSVQSVYQQRQQIIDKLGVKSLTELIHYAIREGLLPPRPAVPPSDSNITAG